MLRVPARSRRPSAAHGKDGDASLNAYLEDHALLLEALLVLYEATCEARWLPRRGNWPTR